MKQMKSLMLLIALMMAVTATAEVRMPAFFGDNMVLQQQSDAPLWGWATPKKKVTVSPSWSEESYTTKADEQGRWRVSLPTPEAGGPYSITISDGEALTLQNVMLGEVWICSGQSNMDADEGFQESACRKRQPRCREGYESEYPPLHGEAQCAA